MKMWDVSWHDFDWSIDIVVLILLVQQNPAPSTTKSHHEIALQILLQKR